MKRRHLDALDSLGITRESYTNVMDCHEDSLPVWGLALRGPHGEFFIEHTPRPHGGDGKYRLRSAQYGGIEISAHSRQQDAVGAAVRRWYRLTERRTTVYQPKEVSD